MLVRAWAGQPQIHPQKPQTSNPGTLNEYSPNPSEPPKLPHVLFFFTAYVQDMSLGAAVDPRSYMAKPEAQALSPKPLKPKLMQSTKCAYTYWMSCLAGRLSHSSCSLG